MMIAAVVLIGLLGAIWRRVLGGWTSTPRYVTVPVMMLFGIPAVLAWGHDTPWIYGMPMYAKAVLVLGLLPLQYLPAVRFTNPWATAARYSGAMLVLFLLSGFWPALAVGPICAGVYWVANKMQWPPIDGKFIDGWSSYGELVVGFTGMAAFAAAAIF